MVPPTSSFAHKAIGMVTHTHYISFTPFMDKNIKMFYKVNKYDNTLYLNS